MRLNYGRWDWRTRVSLFRSPCAALSSPSPRSCGERVGVRGSLDRHGLADSPPHPDCCAIRPLPASGARLRRSPPRLLPPRGEIGQGLLVGCGIKSENRTASAHFLGDKILELGHLEGFIGDLLSDMRGDHDHAVAVAEDDVAGKHRRIAA